VPSSDCSDMRTDLRLVRSISSPNNAMSWVSSPSGRDGVEVSSRVKFTQASGAPSDDSDPITPMSDEGPSPHIIMNLVGDQFRRTMESGPGGNCAPKGGDGSRSSTSTLTWDLESWVEMTCVFVNEEELEELNRDEHASGEEKTAWKLEAVSHVMESSEEAVGGIEGGLGRCDLGLAADSGLYESISPDCSPIAICFPFGDQETGESQ
jgi:hypothetical protein